MKNQYLFLLSIVLFLTCKVSVSQLEYKIIESNLKGKIEYDNSKKTDEIKRVQIYYIYRIEISNKVEGKEKGQLILKDFSRKFNLDRNTFDYKEAFWDVISKVPIPNGEFKDVLDKYDYRTSKISVKYGLKN